MYPTKYYRYLNLPTIPQTIIDNLNYNFDQYEPKSTAFSVYTWSDSFNEEINKWCRENICDEMYWAFQIIQGEFPIHKDIGTKVKFCYLVETGGPDVVTEWYDEDQRTVIDSVILEPRRWHLLKVDAYHGVKNLAPGAVRFAITGRVF